MNDYPSKQDCSFPCPWVGTDHCLLQQLRGAVVEGGTWAMARWRAFTRFTIRIRCLPALPPTDVCAGT